MKDGFIKVAAVTPRVTVAGITENTKEIKRLIDVTMDEQKARIVVFPELCITGYSCGDLFYQKRLLSSALDALLDIAEHTADKNGLVFVGLPFLYCDRLYNVTAAISRGSVLGLVPKTHIPSYGEFYEIRQFTPGMREPVRISLPDGSLTVLGTDILFACDVIPELVVAAEICEDAWVPDDPGVRHAMAGATVIVNPAASDELTGKRAYRRQLIENASARLYAAYIYAGAGFDESTTDTVMSGHDIIAEGGRILLESDPFTLGALITEVDVQTLSARRRQMNTFFTTEPRQDHFTVMFSLEEEDTGITRFVDPMPFVPNDTKKRSERCEEILGIQAYGLKKRLAHIHGKCAVIGISGGLDSTLALLVTVRAFDILKLDRKGIIAVTMPGFGTTDRTYDNAIKLIEKLKVTGREISIRDAVTQHFSDIGHDMADKNVTYENAQARERTQILMDIANENGGIVVGTGDLSELALGWATYNGDHMSMYGVNASVPKTLVRYLVGYYADTCGDEELKDVLYDVLDTPVSPELLPPEDDGTIAQRTEDLVGPYELHDFFLYHLVRQGQDRDKIYRLARIAFSDTYDGATIDKWLTIFYKRFFTSQYKRSCVPDGPKVGTVALSPRGDWRMPSDASYEDFM